MFEDSGKPRVALVMPNGLQSLPNEVAMTWHDPGWPADSRKTTISRRWERRSGSLVDSFNSLWALSLNARDCGHVDYMAMQHADVEPDAWWIDDLMSEMRMRNASVISAVVAIRDHERGRTSTGIAPAGDSWSDTHCLTLEDLEELPQTFGPSQVCKGGECLLINTGCMLIDLRRPEWDDWIWPQDCRFVVGADGVRESRLRTEDWMFSRFMAERGIRYLCTRKILTRHWGMDWWPNRLEDGVARKPRPIKVRESVADFLESDDTPYALQTWDVD